MCNHCLDWEELNGFPVEQKTEILQKINALKNDGLIEYNAQKIAVTPEGQKFIRNIAAIFDYRISHQMNQNRFSSSI